LDFTSIKYRFVVQKLLTIKKRKIMEKSKWYNKWGYLVLWTLLFYPIAVYGVIRTNLINKKIKIGFVSFFVLLTLIFTIQSNIEENEILERNEKKKEEFVSKLDKESNLENKLSLCDSIVKYCSSDSISNHYIQIKDTIYYNLHTFELNDINFINRSKYYTGYTENVDFKTKTITYRKDFVSTELYVYKEVVRKSIKYFTEFPRLDEINFVLYSNENGNKFITNVKRDDIEYIFNIKWDSLRIGNPTASDFGYSIEKELFKVSISKKKLRSNTFKLYLDRTKYDNYISFIKVYYNINDYEMANKLEDVISSIVKSPESLKYYDSMTDSWDKGLDLRPSNKWANYNTNQFGYQIKIRSKNGFGVYLDSTYDIVFKVSGDGYEAVRHNLQ
jgi:hypothetical protein